ncbi:glycosyltransferase family 4 protein [bacterium]|nr:glycosyltransferase family 4 protein [bacterium]
MKVCIVHNEYGKLSGEEVVVYEIQRLLEDHGHQVIPFIRGSAEIEAMFLGSTRAFFAGIYNPGMRKRFGRLLDEEKPDLIHVHNVYPLISPAVLVECGRRGVPVFMTVHNYRLVCPNGLLLSHGDICERCVEGREYWCVLRNCERSLPRSLGYALRNAVARRFRFFLGNVSVFGCLTEFQRDLLAGHGFPRERLSVIPNMAEDRVDTSCLRQGDYVGFAGRVSPEKGADVLIEAARLCPEIPFRVAGDYGPMPHLAEKAPGNVRLLGHVKRDDLDAFYGGCRMLVVPSLWHEAFGLCTVEAMLHAKPVIASRLGALPSIVDDGKTGFLVEPGNPVALAERIREVWSDPDLGSRLGLAGREKARVEYSPGRYYKRLMDAYDRALEK